MKTVAIIVICISLSLNIFQFGNYVNTSKLEKIRDIQISVLKDQVDDLQYQNQTMVYGVANQPHVNIETIKYSSYANGYNDAIIHLGKDLKNGYAQGYHAALMQNNPSDNGIISKN